MHVIGTAGHVDHGKSTLVQALTGTNPDRLKEEREREMTIDLGFAWLSLPNGEDIGIIDVPGHRDFIENMLAGVAGIDAVVFVIAADEGIMPQTREHLAILDLLHISDGVIALTKIDLIDDPDWLDLVEEDIRSSLKGTVLENMAIVRVSVRTHQGIAELTTALSNCLSKHPPRLDLGRPRLPVDRVFTISGFGTVVTGTLSDGQLHIGEEIQVLPNGQRGRIRGLQTHKKKEEIAIPGSRTAINISGINLDQIKRGDVITHPGKYQTTRLLDVRFRLLSDATQPLEHNIQVKLFLGSAEVVSRARLLGSEQLAPGQEGWLQLEVSEPVVAMRGDRYILRRPSPGETLGGGMIVDPHPRKRHKRFSSETIERLKALSEGTPTEILFQAMLSLGAAPLTDVLSRSNLDMETALQAYQELFMEGQIIALEAPGQKNDVPFQPVTLITSRAYWEQIADRAMQEIKNYHRINPLRRGLSREELKSRMKLAPRLFNAVIHKLVAEGWVAENGPIVYQAGHAIQFTQGQKQKIADLLARFAASPYSPPTAKDCINEVGEELYNAMLEQEILVAVPPDLAFTKEDYQTMVTEIRKLLIKEGTITAAQVRDHFNTSRRYALAILEHLDAKGITIREGDIRRLK